MEKVIKATEAVRNFSELLNMIKLKGDHYIITRGGKPVAVMGPVAEPVKERTLGELPEILKSLPRLDEEEARKFAEDLEEIRRLQPKLPEVKEWE